MNRLDLAVALATVFDIAAIGVAVIAAVTAMLIAARLAMRLLAWLPATRGLFADDEA